MCGIAGILGERRLGDDTLVARMIDIQSHRGPNGTGHTVHDGAQLGHARLTVLDPTPLSAQPMETPGGRHVIVFNGEIYNYLELRRELEHCHAFRTTGDTEVLLAAWQKWGPGCLDRLNGMFAFCVWDTKERRAFFARDRFGQKPLFWTALEGRLVFASEIKALIAAGYRPHPNRQAWLRYLVYGSYNDNEETFFANVSQIGAGHYAWWSQDAGLKQSRWYDLSTRIAETKLSAHSAAETVRSLMTDIGKVHMRSDVPIGISLSGGFDSSALLACFELAGVLNKETQCFSVEFDAPKPYSERLWTEAAAASHHLPLTVIPYRPDDFINDILPLIWHTESPLGGLMNCARARVIAEARRAGVKVLQDGTGLDEAFAGYRLHHSLFLGLALRDDPSRAESIMAEYCANWGVNPDIARTEGLAALGSRSGRAIDGTIMVRGDLLDTEAQHESRNIAAPSLSGTGGNQIRGALLNYILISKIPRNTWFTDRMSMAHGVELRLPFLDHRLLELALGLPPALYFLYGRSKSIVREAMAGAMDETVRTATKRSVHTPQGQWLAATPMKEYVGDLITSTSFAERGFFDFSRVRTAFDDFCGNQAPNSFFVWQWINLEEWFRIFVDRSGNQPPTCGEV